MTSYGCLGEKLTKGEEYGGIAEGSCYIRMHEEKNNLAINVLPKMSTGKREWLSIFTVAVDQNGLD